MKIANFQVIQAQLQIALGGSELLAERGDMATDAAGAGTFTYLSDKFPYSQSSVSENQENVNTNSSSTSNSNLPAIYQPNITNLPALIPKPLIPVFPTINIPLKINKTPGN